MKKTVLFLGAGMSASFGYPVTSDILPLIIQKINNGTLFKDVTRNNELSDLYRTLLKELLICLSPGIKHVFQNKLSFKDIKSQVPLVTEFLSQIEHLISTSHSIVDWNFDIRHKLLKPVNIAGRWELSNLKTLFEWSIINVINNTKELEESRNISRLIDWIRKKNKNTRHFTTIVSTNYDVSFEWELLDYGQAWNADKEIDFGVSWRDPLEEKNIVYSRPLKPLYKIFKLHGSTDWLKCKRCGFLYINPTVDIYTLTFSNSKRDANTCHCGFWPLEPLLVTMSYVRKMDEPNLLEIWRNTFEELRTADEWIIVGYSLPSEDFDIRSMFLRAISCNARDLHIKVVQRSKDSKERYDMFFGKENYTFIEGGFEDFAPKLIKANGRLNGAYIKSKSNC